MAHYTYMRLGLQVSRMGWKAKFNSWVYTSSLVISGLFCLSILKMPSMESIVVWQASSHCHWFCTSIRCIHNNTHNNIDIECYSSTHCNMGATKRRALPLSLPLPALALAITSTGRNPYCNHTFKHALSFFTCFSAPIDLANKRPLSRGSS